ncbi:hypothetical protein BHE74_00030861 [Ensete ventricosum]|uniref:Uncharacterized protein n=1 Tax=Ensete ventricosum TaxID=4639 RepID=A0A427BBR8_ENSVE|nr:hypothetical protein B296_00001176 [Ensete ventricosum]RWW62035.1 hypothetical protein BHE74_00030861 [Ensete ventricosum]
MTRGTDHSSTVTVGVGTGQLSGYALAGKVKGKNTVMCSRLMRSGREMDGSSEIGTRRRSTCTDAIRKLNTQRSPSKFVPAG